MKKRVLSVLMSVCMLIGMLPAMSVTASAADDHTGHTADENLWWGIATDSNGDQVLHIASSEEALNGGVSCDVVTAAKSTTNMYAPPWYNHKINIIKVVVDDVVRPKKRLLGFMDSITPLASI